MAKPDFLLVLASFYHRAREETGVLYPQPRTLYLHVLTVRLCVYIHVFPIRKYYQFLEIFIFIFNIVLCSPTVYVEHKTTIVYHHAQSVPVQVTQFLEKRKRVYVQPKFLPLLPVELTNGKRPACLQLKQTLHFEQHSIAKTLCLSVYDLSV